MRTEADQNDSPESGGGGQDSSRKSWKDPAERRKYIIAGVFGLIAFAGAGSLVGFAGESGFSPKSAITGALMGMAMFAVLAILAVIYSLGFGVFWRRLQEWSQSHNEKNSETAFLQTASGILECFPERSLVAKHVTEIEKVLQEQPVPDSVEDAQALVKRQAGVSGIRFYTWGIAEVIIYGTGFVALNLILGAIRMNLGRSQLADALWWLMWGLGNFGWLGVSQGGVNYYLFRLRCRFTNYLKQCCIRFGLVGAAFGVLLGLAFAAYLDSQRKKGGLPPMVYGFWAIVCAYGAANIGFWFAYLYGRFRNRSVYDSSWRRYGIAGLKELVDETPQAGRANLFL